MAIINNNVQNVKFLRNGSLYATRDAARTALEDNKSLGSDGSAILARYSGISATDVKTLVGFIWDNGTNKTVTIFDIEGASADVEALRQEINDKLGTSFISSSNTVEANLTALSGSSSDTSATTSVAGAKKYADDLISTLDVTDTAVEGSYVSQVSEADGKISVSRVALPDASSVADNNKIITDVTQSKGAITATASLLSGVKLSGYTVGGDDSGKVAETDTLGQALGKLQGQINGMDLAVVSGNGEVITAVFENDGKVSANKTAIKDVKLTGYVKDDNKSGALAATDDIEDALSKIENNIAAAQSATTLSAADKSINVVTAASGTTVALNIRSGEKVLKLDTNATSGGVYTDIDLVKITTGLPAEIKERYQLLASDDSQIGSNIDIPKDSHIVSITYITDSSDPKYQNLKYEYIDVSGNTQTTYVDMSALVIEAEFASGVTFSYGVAHGVVDSTSEKDSRTSGAESFLTVGTDGFKISGIKDEIDRKINALDVAVINPGAGKYIYAIEENEGKIAASGASISEAVLNNYSKGSDSGAVVSTDTINAAISKLENQIDSKVDALDATVSGKTADGKVNVKVTETNGVITAVDVVGTDIASDSALTAEIAARKAVDGQSGQTYAANASSPYISGARDLNDADVKLAAALKSLSDETVNQVKVNNIALTETSNAVNVQISAAAGTGAASTPITVDTDSSTGAVTLKLEGIDCGTY